MRKAIMTLLVVIGATSCLTSRVRNTTLLPAIQDAWPNVRADVEYADSMLDSELAEWDNAVATGDFRSVDVQDLQMQAVAGVDMRLMDGQIGPQGAAIMRDRAAKFAAAIREYMRPAVATHPLVISRSSWATYPPSVLAARTRH